MEEFADLLEKTTMDCDKRLLVGDFNFHVDIADNPDAKKFLDLLDTVNLAQHVDIPTHSNGHTLDLVISRPASGLHVTFKSTDRSVSSDHFSVLFTVRAPRPPRAWKKVNIRKWRDIDPESLIRT